MMLATYVPQTAKKNKQASHMCEAGRPCQRKFEIRMSKSETISNFVLRVSDFPHGLRLRACSALPRLSLLFVLTMFAFATEAGELLFDFGTEKSPVAAGFTAVTPGSAWAEGAVFGWVGKPELTAVDSPVDPKPVMNDHSGRLDPPKAYTDVLSQDHIEGAAPAVFRVAAPKGAYKVWLLLGIAGPGADKKNGYRVWDTHVACAGAEATATFPGIHEARTLTMDVTSSGTLDFAFTTKNKWLINGMAIVPADAWVKVHAEKLAGFEQDVYMLPKDLLATWKLKPHEEKLPMPSFTKEEQERGLVLYTRSYLSCVWPNTAPLRSEIDADVKAFATWGEYEPLNFVIHPLRDLKGVRVAFSELKSKTGQLIQPSSIDVRYVKYMWVRPNYTTVGVYYPAPDVLMPLTAADLTKGENFRVWATVRVCEGTPAGVYVGKASVLCGDKKIHEVGVKLRVLPIVLEKDQSLGYQMYYNHPYRGMNSASDPFSREWFRNQAETEHADMVAHGMNGITLGVWAPAPKDGKWTFNFDSLAETIDLCRKNGFDRPMALQIPTFATYSKYVKAPVGSHLRGIQVPPQAFFDEVTEMVAKIEAERKARQWPEFLYYPVDEPSTSADSVAFMVEVMKAIKKVPGVRTYVTAEPAHEQFKPMFPFVDVWCCQPFEPEREVVVADMKKRPGVEYWCYPNHANGENDHTTVTGARMTYGFGLWKSGFRTLIPWIYQSVAGNPWNYLDGPYMDFFVRTADDGSPIPVAMWEAYREGIDDGRYITTLERWIERAKAAGREDLAKPAADDLKFVWDSIKVQAKYKYDGMWDTEAFDVYRWIIARRILELQSALPTR